MSMTGQKPPKDFVTRSVGSNVSETVEKLFRRAMDCCGREDFNGAARLFRQAATLVPEKELWQWKSLGFCPTTFTDEESIDRYWERLDRSLDLALDKNLPMDWRSLPTDGFCPSFNLPHLGKSCKEIRAKFGRLFEGAFSFAPPKTKRPEMNRGRWRIGFHTLHGHEGGFTRCTAGLIDNLDQKRFEIFVFAPDLGIEQCKKAIHRSDVTFVPLGGTFEKVVDRVRETGCNLIYYRKAGSDPWSWFFPFARCAPVQVTSCGTHGTSGIRTMDYFLSSSSIEPSDAQAHYTEKLVRLDSMHLYLDRLPVPETPVSRGEFNLPEKGSIYFCPHRTAKYHPKFDTVFRAILDRDPTAMIVLLTGRHSRGRKGLLERLQSNLGRNRFERLIFFQSLPYEKYKRLLSLTSVLLDSPVYAGGLTSYDAASYGIPEVTLSGPLLVQNFATGVYRKMGLDEIPCRSLDEYVDRAIRLGTEREYRLATREAILAKNETIFCSGETVREHERFFEAACSESCR